MPCRAIHTHQQRVPSPRGVVGGQADRCLGSRHGRAAIHSHEGGCGQALPCKHAPALGDSRGQGAEGQKDGVQVPGVCSRAAQALTKTHALGRKTCLALPTLGPCRAMHTHTPHPHAHADATYTCGTRTLAPRQRSSSLAATPACVRAEPHRPWPGREVPPSPCCPRLPPSPCRDSPWRDASHSAGREAAEAAGAAEAAEAAEGLWGRGRRAAAAAAAAVAGLVAGRPAVAACLDDRGSAASAAA